MTTHEPSIPSDLESEANACDPTEGSPYSPREQELVERLRNAEARAAFLSDLDQAVQPVAEPDEVMFVTARMLAEHLEADRCAYAEVEDESIFVITGDFALDVPSIVGNWPVAAFGHECERQMLANEAYIVTDTDVDDRIGPEDLPAYRATTIRAVICVPLHKQGKFTAAMAVHQKVPRVWTAAEIDLVQTTVNRCWESLERTRAARVLRDSEETYRLLAETASDAIIRIDEDNIVRFVNSAATRIFGYTANELIGHSLSKIMPPELRDGHRAGMARYLKTGKRRVDWTSVEVRAQRKDGHQFPLELSFGESQRDGKRFFIGVARDITERRQTEDALRESEHRLRTMADSIPQLAWMAEPDGNIFWYNQKWYEYTGSTPEEMEGNGWQAFHHPEMILAVVELWASSLKSGLPFAMEFPLRSAGGSYRWFLTRVNPLRNAEGEIVRWFGTNTDIQERREAEETLRQNQLLLSLAMRSSRMGGWKRDVIADSIWWSEELEAIFGLEKGSFSGTEKEYYDLIVEEDRAAARSAVSSAIAEHRDYSFEFRFHHASGEIRWMEGRGQAVYSEDGEPITIYGVGIDITERKSLEASFLASEERFRSLMEQAPLSIQLFDMEGRTVNVNRAWEDLWGTTLEQLGEYNILRDAQLESAGIAAGIRRAFAGEALELPAIRYDPNKTRPGLSSNADAVKWTSAVVYPLKGPDGELREVALVHQDITERKRAEDKLEQQKRLLEGLTESVLDGILIVAPGGEIAHHNQQFVDIWNFPPEVLETRSDEAALAWAAEQTADPTAFLERVDHIYSEPDIQFREEMLMNDGRVYERFGAPVQHGETRLGWVWTFRDITERKRMEKAVQRHGEELEATVRQRTHELRETNRGLKAENRERRRLEAERLKLLAAITTVQEDERRRMALDLHDHLGQQLTALSFRVEILRMRGYAASDFDRLVADVHGLVRQVDEDVDSLSWGLRPPSLDDIGLVDSLADYIREWSRRFELPVKFRNSRFGKKRLPAESETHLYRITQEILTNICKHAKATSVDITLEKRRGRAILTVVDDGVGFVPKKHKSSGGSGIGLIGMRERAAIMGGTLTVESEPGRGTLIIVDVPALGAQKMK